MLPLLASLGRMAISSKVGKKVATESAKKSGKKVAEKIFNRDKKDSIEKVDSGKGSAIVKVPKVSTKIISADALFGDQKKVESDKKDSAKITESFFDDILDVLKSIKISLSKIQETLNERKAISSEQEVQDRKETSKRRSKKRETKLEGKKRKGSLGDVKFNTSGIPFIDRIMNFFGMVLIGSLVLFLYKKINEIIKFFEDTFLKIKEFFKAIEPFVKPIWDGMKWIVGGGASTIAKILGVPSQEADTNGIKKNLEEITKKIPIIGDIFKGIQNTIDSIRSGRGLTPTQTGSGGGATSTASGDLFEIISGGEGGVNSVNRGVAGDTPGGARSIFGKNLTDMTVDQIYAAQRAGKVSAVGKYQIIEITMPGFISYLKNRGIDTSRTKFTEEVQDMFRNYVIDFKRPEVGKYIRGESSNRNEAVQELAREFASVGLAYSEAGRVRGQSRYAGSAENRASISPEAVAAALDRARSGRSISSNLPQQKQKQADATAQQAAAESSVPTIAPPGTLESSSPVTSVPGTLASPAPQPTSLEPTATQAQVAPTQAPPVLSESVPQIMQQAEYEIQGTQNNIFMIASGKSGNNLMTSGSRSMILSVSKKEALNSYYQSQLIGFLYKQG